MKRELAKTFVLIAGIQLFFLLVSYLFRTDLLFDLSGGLTFAAAFWYTNAAGPSTEADAAKLRITLFGTLWAARLGGFLFWRILQTGGDARFDGYLAGPLLRFAVPWALQIAWISAVGLPIYLANLSSSPANGGGVTCTDAAGYAVSALGLFAETVADFQKWRSDRNKLLDTGLFGAVRYPQYAGEIAVWSGVAMSSWSLLSTNAERAASLLSPAVTFVLLRFVSGIPLAEARRFRKFGEEYARLSKRIPLLFP